MYGNASVNFITKHILKKMVMPASLAKSLTILTFVYLFFLYLNIIFKHIKEFILFLLYL